MNRKYFSVAFFIHTLVSLMISSALNAQSPQRINYQEIVRNSNGILVENIEVGMRITIFSGTKGPTSEFIETHKPTTDENGVVSIEIGAGTLVSGSLSNIDWSTGTYSVKTETDPEGGTNYTITGTSQLLSVPYVLHAKTAGALSGSLIETDPVYTSWDKDYNDLINKPDFGTYSIGDFAHGGIVFWVDETGRHGLVCSKNDYNTRLRWYAGTIGRTLSMSKKISAGKANTQIIIAAHVAIGDDGALYAARACNEMIVTEGGKSYGDWFLPSVDEMSEIYLRMEVINATAVANGGSVMVVTPNSFYWSSTERDAETAFAFSPEQFVPIYHMKTSQGHIRPVRAF